MFFWRKVEQLVSHYGRLTYTSVRRIIQNGGVKLFHVNLKRLREAAGFTQATLADRLDTSLRTYQGWEQGHREPPLSTVRMIARVLDVSADELLAEAETPPAKKTTKKRKEKTQG
jgi:transcriptional regulator with XRE-family HTH domain